MNVEKKKKHTKPWHNLEVGSTEFAQRLDTVGNMQEGMNNAEETLGKMAPIIEIWKNVGGTGSEGILNILFGHVKLEIPMKHPSGEIRGNKIYETRASKSGL